MMITENKIVNYSCFCKNNFNYTDKVLYIIPCCHIIHETCLNNYILKNYYTKLNKIPDNKKDLKLNCPFCKEKIKNILIENKINSSKNKYEQYKIDIKSIKLNNTALINYMILPLSMIKFTSLINKLVLVNNEKELLSTIEYLLTAFNIKINIIDNTKKNPIKVENNNINWKKKEDNNRKLVIISNHAHYLDSVIMYYLFRSGFISSDFIMHTDIGRIIATKLKLLIFKRGVDTNMVDKIKEYLNEMKRIIIY